nr:uncharacterized protein LOC117689936 [Crassostrea gigas]
MRHKGRIISAKTSKKLSNLKRFTKKEEEESVEENQTTEEFDSQANVWNGERRVIELDILIEGLRSCVHCSNPLRLEWCVSERKYGLASIFYIKCSECNGISPVYTGKKHNTANKSGPAKCFDVNTKLAAAMINVGIGEQQMNNILAELNIPSINHKTLKEREREVGRAFEEVADKSCNNALRDEIIFQQNRGSPASLQKNLEAIVPHAFGEHVKCDVHWCGFLKAPNLYKHKSLPHG